MFFPTVLGSIVPLSLFLGKTSLTANGQITSWRTYKHLQPLGAICIFACQGGSVTFTLREGTDNEQKSRNSQRDPTEDSLQLYYSE